MVPHRSLADWALPLLIISAGIAVYLNSFSGVFLFDDLHQIVGNDRIRSLESPGPMLASRRPVAELSFAVNYAIGGLAPAGYHAVNLAIHILSALALFGVVRRTLKTPGLLDRFGDRASCLALVAALLWVVHPAHTQAVAYVVQRSESLMGLFYLLTLYAVIRGAEGRDWLGWYTLAVGACALGMGTKAVMISAPIAILAYDRVFLSGSFIRALGARWLLHFSLFGTWAVLWYCGVAPAVLGLTEQRAHVGFSYAGVSPVAYLLTQAGVLVHYLRLSFWPWPLCLDYGWPTVDSASDWMGSALVILPLLAAAGWAVWNRPRIGWVVACFFLILAPTSSIVPIRDPIFEHRLYLPLACLIVGSVIGGDAILGLLRRRYGWPRGVTIAIATVLVLSSLLLMGRTTALRCRDYSSPIAMWSDAARKRPGNVRAQSAHGNALRDAKNRTDEAVAAFRRAVTSDAESFEAFYGLGNALHDQGNIVESADAYREAVRLHPAHADSQNALGAALVDLGEFADAEKAYRVALNIKPNDPRVLFNFGNLMVRLGRSAEAIEAYRDCLSIQPDDVEARTNLGIRLGSIGLLNEAGAAFRQAIKTDPRHAKAHYNYGILLVNQGTLDPAIAAFRKAIRLDPAYANAHHNLGVALWKTNAVEEAIAEFRETLRLNPDHPGAKQSLRAAGVKP